MSRCSGSSAKRYDAQGVGTEVIRHAAVTTRLTSRWNPSAMVRGQCLVVVAICVASGTVACTKISRRLQDMNGHQTSGGFHGS